jgi:hypothetical protein
MTFVEPARSCAAPPAANLSSRGTLRFKRMSNTLPPIVPPIVGKAFCLIKHQNYRLLLPIWRILVDDATILPVSAIRL